MADKKISQLPASTTPLAGTEVLPVVQDGDTKQVSVANLTAGRDLAGKSLTLEKALGATLTLKNPGTAVVDSEIVGAVDYFSNDASAPGASVRAYVRAVAADQFSRVDLRFGTADNAQAVSEKFRLTYNGNANILNGNLVIGTAGKGIDFSADGQAAGMTSELLDDYEEGTWTPVLGGSGGTSGQTYGTQAGTYTKIGNLVCAVFETTLSAKGTITSNVQIQGLPFPVSSASNGGSAFSKIAWLSSVTAQLVGTLAVGGTVATLRQAGLNGDNVNLTTANINDNTSIVGCFIYRA